MDDAVGSQVLCTHLSARHRCPGCFSRGSLGGWLCMCLGKAQRWVIPHPDIQRQSRETTTNSHPPLQFQGLGFGGYTDFGTMGTLG